MEDLQVELPKLADTLGAGQKAYDDYLEASKKHNDKILTLAEMQPIDIADFSEAEDLYNEMILSETNYRIQKELFNLNRQEVITKIAPVQNIKIKFTYTGERVHKDTTDYYIWLKYNAGNRDKSQLVLQKRNDELREPLLL